MIPQGDEDELRVFAGHSQVLSRKQTPSPLPQISGDSQSPDSNIPSSIFDNANNSDVRQTTPDVHPSVLKYLFEDPIANASQHTTDSTLLAWFRSCDPPGIPNLTLDHGYSISPSIGETELGPTMLDISGPEMPPVQVTNGNDQWMSFLTQYNIIDSDAMMEDVVGTNGGSFQGIPGDLFR